MFELFHVWRGTFCQGFNPAVIEIPHKADNLMPRRGALCKESKANALHVASDEKSSSYPVGHYFNRVISILASRQQLNNREAARRNVYADDVGHSGLFPDRQRLVAGPLGCT